MKEEKKRRLRILLADDDDDILEILSYNLEKEGYKVYKSRSGKEAIEKALAKLPDLIILDVMMPGIDGIETCEKMNAQPKLQNILKIFLTARSEDFAQIAGLECGADDYITKPVKPKVFVAKVKALLRRKHHDPFEKKEKSTELPNLRINHENYLVYRHGREMKLPRKEFELLKLLTSKPGRVFSREEILYKVWGEDVVVNDRTIDVHIRKLREKLELKEIITVKGVGYKIEF